MPPASRPRTPAALCPAEARAPLGGPLQPTRARAKRSLQKIKTTLSAAPRPLPSFSHHLVFEQLGDVLAAPLLSQAANEEGAIFIGREYAKKPAVLELEAVHGVDGPVGLLAGGEADVAVAAAPATALVAGDANLGDLAGVLKPIPEHVATRAPRQPPHENFDAALGHEVTAVRPRGPQVYAPLSVVVVVVVVEGIVEVAAVMLLLPAYFLTQQRQRRRRSKRRCVFDARRRVVPLAAAGVHQEVPGRWTQAPAALVVREHLSRSHEL